MVQFQSHYYGIYQTVMFIPCKLLLITEQSTYLLLVLDMQIEMIYVPGLGF